jgi:hypothetical protein
MKTSKILVLSTGLIFLIFLIVFVSALREHARSIIEKQSMTYFSLPSYNFDMLDLSSSMQVKIKQGKDCTIEYASNGKIKDLKAFIKIKDNTLIVHGDSTFNNASVHLKISMPFVKKIIANNGTEISMNFFQSDFTNIELGNNCAFKANNNTLKHVIFNTTGQAKIDITNSF